MANDKTLNTILSIPDSFFVYKDITETYIQKIPNFIAISYYDEYDNNYVNDCRYFIQNKFGLIKENTTFKAFRSSSEFIEYLDKYCGLENINKNFKRYVNDSIKNIYTMKSSNQFNYSVEFDLSDRSKYRKIFLENLVVVEGSQNLSESFNEMPIMIYPEYTLKKCLERSNEAIPSISYIRKQESEWDIW